MTSHLICLIAGIIAALSAINYGFMLSNKDLITKLFGTGNASKVVKGIITVSGVLSLICLLLWSGKMYHSGVIPSE
jgi:uncharacterized membrane protein YuzA (DUF378 family)